MTFRRKNILFCVFTMASSRNCSDDSVNAEMFSQFFIVGAGGTIPTILELSDFRKSTRHRLAQVIAYAEQSVVIGYGFSPPESSKTIMFIWCMGAVLNDGSHGHEFWF